MHLALRLLRATPTAATLLAAIALVAAAIEAPAQNPCAGALDAATRAYDEGRLGDVVEILIPCVGSLRDQRWQGYRLLALANLFLDRPREADEAVDAMLQSNPRYQIDPATDPAELARLVEEYRIFPRVALGLRGGLSLTGRRIDEPRSIVPGQDVLGERRFAVGNDLGIGVIVAIVPDLSLSLEAISSTRAYAVDLASTSGALTEYSERLSYVTLPLMARYGVDIGGLVPHVAAGYYYQMLLDATSDITMRPGDSSASYADEGVLSTESRRASSNHGIVFGAGLSLPLGDGMLTLDGRYELGLGDVVRSGERYSDDDLLFRYLYVDNGFRLRNLILSLGYVHPISYSASR